MRVVDLIIKKRNGENLSRSEISFLVKGLSNGDIPDYQTSAFLMAVYFNGMSTDELSGLTEEMINSGDVFDLGDVPGIKVDKHSTGGVGDKVSLILAPAVAVCGVVVPMVSGRALGHTGGTLDKLESIPGYQTTMNCDAFARQLNKIGVAIIGQSNKFVPADKKLYALRDLTGTIESIPLIAASIMSKKIASGTEALVMDVKTGNGAFMAEESRALELAKTLVQLGTTLGKPTVALITDMNQPLGKAVGNSLEVIECIETMQGNGPTDLHKITCVLGAHMLVLAGITKDTDDAMTRIDRSLKNGDALKKFREMVVAQKGNPRIIDDFSLFDVSKKDGTFCASQDGFVAHINTLEVGVASMLLGAGRTRIEDPVDYGVGFVFHKKVGDAVAKNEPICDIYYRKDKDLEAARERLNTSITVSSEPVEIPRLIKSYIDFNGTKVSAHNG